MGGELLEVGPEEGLAAGEGEERYLGLVLEDAYDPLPLLGAELPGRVGPGARVGEGRGGAGGLAA